MWHGVCKTIFATPRGKPCLVKEAFTDTPARPWKREVSRETTRFAIVCMTRDNES